VTSDWPSKGKRIGRPTISRRLRERRPKIFSGTPIGIVRRECLDRLLIFGESPPPAPQWQKSVIIMPNPRGPAAPTFAAYSSPPRMILEYLGIAKRLALAIAKGRPGAMPSDLGTNCRSAPVPFIT
jgi:hypothetical protein